MAIVSKSEFARRKGISPAMVTKLCSSGRIPVLKSGKLDFDKASEAYEATRQVGREISAANGKKARGATPEQTELPPDDAGLAGGSTAVAAQFNKAKTAEKVYQAKLKKLEYEEKEGSLIAKDTVADDAFLAANELRSRLFSIAPRAAPRCEGKTAREIERIIEDEINFALQALQESRFIKQEE
ncbi:hypothetical protein LDR49_002727 [Salmonella enterica]|nr:hypothetical protein [Salmonella enterica]EBK2971763.1 hypothetical protein [Salmonella enterica]EBR7328709.1 hypothetical protein [Salmonella enterica]EDC2511642.1 hypothetical protein [Salmonella enterica]EDK3144986.1 hypothetical protein [Salmonella enterica]